MPSLRSEIADKALSLLVTDLKLSTEEKISTFDPSDPLAQEINIIKLALAAFQDHVKSRILDIRRKRNRLVPITPREQNQLIPINRLPPELLAKILVNVTDISEIEDCHDDALVLAGVSSFWYSICLSTPRIWNRLSNVKSIEFTRLRLERSKEVPLHVIHAIYVNDQPRPLQDEKPFLDMVAPHMSRWKTFSIASRHVDELTRMYLAGKCAPILESFDLTNWQSITENSVNTQFPSLNMSAPSLHTLKTGYFPFPLRLEPGLLSNLRNIQFTPSINGASFSPEQYDRLLSSAPNLEQIIIKGAPSSQQPIWGIDDPFEVELHSLRMIQFRCVPWKIIHLLLSSILTAPDQYTYCGIISPSIREHPPIPFPQSASPHSLLAKIRTSDRLTAGLQERSDCDNTLCVGLVTGFGPMRMFDLVLERDHDNWRELLYGLIASMRFLRVKMVDLMGLNIFYSGYLQWNDSFLPDVEDIRFRSMWFSVRQVVKAQEEMIQWLSSPVTSPQGPFWICPRLRCIAFDCLVEKHSLLQLLKARGKEAIPIATSGSLHGLELVEMMKENKRSHRSTPAETEDVASRSGVELRYRDLSN